MKKISEHLGEIIVALACVALLISAITVFDAPVSGFFTSIVAKETAIGSEVMTAIENTDTSNIGVDGSVANDPVPEPTPTPETDHRRLLIGTWTTEARDFYVTFNADGTGILMNGADESSATTCMTFTYDMYLGSISWIDYTMIKEGDNMDTFDQTLYLAWHINSTGTRVTIGKLKFPIKLS